MILADKITQLRKKNGWSQEQFAAELGVSRQAISKWESAQSIPDISRILEMSEIFGVSTDFLIKDELELSEAGLSPDGHGSSLESTSGTALRQVTMEEATNFLELKTRSTRPIASGVAMIIAGAAFLIVLIQLASAELTPFSENVATAIGVTVLLVLIAIAVAIFIFFGLKTKPFEYLEKENFDTAYGVSGMVKQRQEQLSTTFTLRVITGVILCFLAAIAFVVASFMDDTEPMYNRPIAYLIGFAFLSVAVAVYLFITVGIPSGAMTQILQEGDFSPNNKAKSRIMGPIIASYWVLVTALYLGYSLISSNWSMSWVIWPIAGLIFAALLIILNTILDRRNAKI